MAESKSKQSSDPTIKSGTTAPAYPEGTHEARPPSQTAHSAERFTYTDNPDKPDPSTVAQLVTGPLPNDPK